jgi:Flp pilus assembly protein TadD
MTRTVKTTQRQLAQIRSCIRSGDFGGALRLCVSSATDQMSPGERADLMHLQGIALWQAGDRDRAIKSLTVSVSLDPSKAVVWTALARLQRETGQIMAGLGSALSAIRVDPKHAAAHIALGDLFRDGRRPKRALAAYEAAMRISPELEGARFGLAMAKATLGDAAGAVSLYEGLVRSFPDRPTYRLNLAISLVHAGDGTGAARVAADLLQVPSHGSGDVVKGGVPLREEVLAGALSIVLQHERDRSTREALTAAKEMAARHDVGWRSRAKLLSVIGRHQDRIGDKDGAMRSWSERARISASETPYHRQALDLLLSETRRVWTPDLMSRLSAMGGRPESPILIVGMPRSGTTLVEQILGYHPQVDTGGELYDLNDVFRELMGGTASRGSLQGLINTPEETLRALIRKGGGIYADALDQYRGSGSRVTDKMPENFKMLGVAAAIMPNLRILHMRRDPRDVCFSIWKLRFENDGHTYGNRFEDLAHYYRVHEELMAHWSAILPGVIHTVSYEDLVADPEREGRRLVEHCGLDWSSDLLDFSDSHRGVRTASASQVREGLNRKGIGRWRAFEAQLSPLLEALRAEGLIPDAVRRTD